MTRMSVCNKTVSILWQLLLWMACTGSLYAQEKGFLYTYGDSGHSWLAKDAVETESGEFIIGARNRWGSESVLLKVSAEGGFLGELPIAAEDTTVLLTQVLILPNEQQGDFVALCPCEPMDGSNVALLFVRFDDDLNVTLRKALPCPFAEQAENFFSVKAIAVDSCIFAAFTMQVGNMPNHLSSFLVAIDKQGCIVRCQQLDSFGSICSVFCAADETNRIGIFGQLYGGMGIQTFDETFALVSSDTISQWSAIDEEAGLYCLYHVSDVINSQAAMLPNGSCLVSARLGEQLYSTNGVIYSRDQSVILAKYENDFHQPENMVVTEHMNDSVEYPAFYRSMFVRETNEMGCEVFQCAILNELPQFGLLQPFPTGIVVSKTDQDLNVVWKKRFLRDGNYQAMTINATSDGGCLVVGSIGDYQEQRLGVFALKINAEGIVDIKEIEEKSMAFVYPNPAKETIGIGGVEVREAMVYNALGQQVMSFSGNEADVKGLAAGVYLLEINDKEGRRHTLRIIVGE